MIGFLNYLKIKIKYVLGLSLVSALLATVIMPALPTRADSPQFNFLPGDYELFTGRNATNKEEAWRDPVTGSAGDTFDGLIYYHNGYVNTTAKNTRIRMTIPVSTSVVGGNNAATLSASASADNAATVYDTIINSQVNGKSGLTVVLDQAANLEFVPGSVQWFPNVGQDGRPINPSPLPDGVNGNDIISSNGLNIGDVQGCWEFSGFVAFKFRTVGQAHPSLSLQKTVRNVSNNEPNFGENTIAKPNDTVEFNIAVGNNGNVPVDNIIVRDALPAELAYVPGSFVHVAGTTVTPKPDTEANQLFDGGWPMGHPLVPGETHNLRFRAQATTVVAAAQVVTNTAFVSAGAISLADTATVSLQPVVTQIEKHKGATNTTSGKQALPAVAGNKTVLAVSARPGDEIVYSLTARSINGATNNFVVEDDIADILEGADVTKISDSGQIAGNIIRWPAINLAQNQPLTFTFTIRVKNQLPVNPPFDDKLVNVYGDEVNVNIVRPTPLVPNLKIEKSVRNFTINEPNFVDANEAIAGDILEYRINFANEGNGPADQVKFSDVLPPNTQYLMGTTIISRNGGPERTLLDGATAAGITLDQIAAGESGYLKFRVRISDRIAVGEILVNTAYLTHANQTISDTASTKIKVLPVRVEKPILPPMLPKTGPAAGASFLITFMVGTLFTYAKYIKVIKEGLEIAKVASSIVGI